MGVPFKRFRPGHRPAENYCRFRHLFHSCASLSGAAFYFSIFCTIHDSLSLRTEQLRPYKEKCIKGNSKVPLEERSKALYVSKRFMQQRERMEVMVNTSLGKLLRVNRSIQAGGFFAMTKEDMSFRRFLLRSTVKVDAEWTILTMAYDILKLYHKLLSGRLGTHLAVPTSFPAGL